jgi:hypothetical protein
MFLFWEQNQFNENNEELKSRAFYIKTISVERKAFDFGIA